MGLYIKYIQIGIFGLKNKQSGNPDQAGKVTISQP
jgi:hypothetical protein